MGSDGLASRYKVVLERPMDIYGDRKDREFIVGYSEKPFSLSADPSYNDYKGAGVMGQFMDKAFEYLGNIQSLEGAQLFGGLNTYQVYSGASPWSFSVNFKVVNTGNYEPILYAKTLLSWCQPTSKNLVESAVYRGKNYIGGKAGESAGNLLDVLKNMDLKAIAELFPDALIGAGLGFLGIEEETGKKELAAFGDQIEKLVAAGESGIIGDISKHVIKFSFGNIFKEPLNTVITGANIEFSNEQMEQGPLYANFDVSLKTQKTLTEGEVRDQFWNGKNLNVNFEDTSQTNMAGNL